MLVEAGALAYLGLACLARGNHRFVALPLPGGRTIARDAARTAGWAALAAALAVAIAALGPAQGLVAFVGVAGLAGIALALALSVRPRGALAPTVPLLLPLARRRRGADG